MLRSPPVLAIFNGPTLAVLRIHDPLTVAQNPSSLPGVWPL